MYSEGENIIFYWYGKYLIGEILLKRKFKNGYIYNIVSENKDFECVSEKKNKNNSCYIKQNLNKMKRVE